MSFFFTWMRLSSTKQLDWYRNSSYQSKDIAHVQKTITQRIADKVTVLPCPAVACDSNAVRQKAVRHTTDADVTIGLAENYTTDGDISISIVSMSWVAHSNEQAAAEGCHTQTSGCTLHRCPVWLVSASGCLQSGYAEIQWTEAMLCICAKMHF